MTIIRPRIHKTHLPPPSFPQFPPLSFPTFLIGNPWTFPKWHHIIPQIFLLLTAMLAAPSVGFAEETLVVYSGRAERLIQPALDAFQAESGVTVRMLTADSTALVNRLRMEGDRTPADVLITNDAGSLERARELRLLRPATIPDVEQTIPPPFRAPDNSWIGLSGRIWVVVYNTSLVNPDDLTSILDLADPKWKGMVAIPSAGSVYLQTGVSVIRAVKGEEATIRFLRGVKDNAGSLVYGKNRQIVAAVARGEVAVGLVNHYYILRHLAKHPDAPIAPLLTDQEDNGMGSILNAAGVGMTAYTQHRAHAQALIRFLISPKGQRLFADVNKEYPLNPRVAAAPELIPLENFRAASVPLSHLAQLRDPTMTLIEDVGLR